MAHLLPLLGAGSPRGSWRVSATGTPVPQTPHRRALRCSIMQNKVVVHFLDGRIVKGVTNDFFPNKPVFHVIQNGNGKADKTDVSQLKAIFFVKSFEGDVNHMDRRNVERTGLGKRIRVKFKDGEILIGYTTGYAANRPAFFVFPADPKSNNDRVFVLSAATDDVSFL
jgi:hypothetical protein